MIRTVVAITNEQLRGSVADILKRNGINVRMSCRTALEAIRSIRKMGGGVVICSSRLPDMTADDLSYELKGQAYLLVLGRPESLKFCDDEDIFKVPLPVHSDELCGSVRILLQLDERRDRAGVPERSDEDKEVIIEAKEYLMQHNEMTEEQAHRFLQKRSMETSTPMADVAKLVLYNAE
ncbi:MAG: ANTAR domain-containing protein [Lachnospiraceae bacterium]|jgi:response regulator NasT|nr:ANTAR domain-containing protein [Lachnospiraceae bacterium]MDD4525998.1 ANTAR domain-containing protein [Lachnospiraceae bacterium]